MAELTVDGLRVHYREAGVGPAVVLLHAGGGSGAQWRRVAERLGEGWRLVTVDFYGHGGTDLWPGPPEARTHEAEAGLVRAVLRQLGARPAHVVGHSYGGGVALRLAVTDPGAVERLVLIEPQCWAMLRHGAERAHYEAACATAHRFLGALKAGRPEDGWRDFIDDNNGPGAWARLPEAARARLLATTEAIASAYYANLSHSTTPGECRAIGAPTLVLHGAATLPRYRRMTELVAEAIPGARLDVLPEAGHMSPLSHPDLVAAAVERHLRGVVS
ncbi:MAG TPA: alpha/beta hydrolase [Methylomirabilota bacterium]|nr:alpha/beta hydrolase [Methylomirabilota bacterium]